MGNYEICVMNMETYTVTNAKTEEEAKIIAMDYFRDDDMYYGTKETENVTIDDCEVVWFEEC